MKRVLICPLDWGLGHATRCIPLVRELQRQGAMIFIASSGPPGVLLQKEFRNLTYAELPGYAPVYPMHYSMTVKMLSQLPKFIRVVRQEHDAVEKLVQKHEIDIVISDNRYGCYSARARCVFITHQINVMLPEGWALLGLLVNAICHRYIHHFGEVWVPDQEGSGLTTAFFSRLDVPVKFIGWLSRFDSRQSLSKKYDVVAIASGPEPQRSLFSDMCFDQLAKSGLKALLVSGELDKDFHRVEGMVEVINHLPALEMEEALRASDVIIARSGYSTIMDLIALGKKAIFVPTPQQPEQIFLGRHLMDEGIAFCVEQDQFVLESAMKKVDAYQGLSVFTIEQGVLEKEIKNLLI